MTDPTDNRIGETIDDKFTLREILGRGGMATVYLADQHSMERQVAIKLLHKTPITNQNNVRRFMREAKSASKLSHPNIVKVFDFGTTQSGEMYLVMEHLKGAPLHDILSQEKVLHPLRAVDLLSQVCEGLSEAHQHGVVHRDLTPSNIFVARSGDGKEEFCTVLDFGIAHTQSADGTTKLTLTGAVLGTPQYMSPEQTMGEEVTPQSDIYSMGIVLYEMLTGAPPFQHSAVGRVLVSHINEMPKPFDRSQMRYEIPLPLEALVMQMLSKEPADRPPSSLAVKTLLRQACDQDSVLYTTPETKSAPDTSDMAFAPTLNVTPTPDNPIAEPTLAYRDTTDEDGLNDDSNNDPPHSEESFFPSSGSTVSTTQNRTFGWLLAATLLGLASFLLVPRLFSTDSTETTTTREQLRPSSENILAAAPPPMETDTAEPEPAIDEPIMNPGEGESSENIDLVSPDMPGETPITASGASDIPNHSNKAKLPDQGPQSPLAALGETEGDNGGESNAIEIVSAPSSKKTREYKDRKTAEKQRYSDKKTKKSKKDLNKESKTPIKAKMDISSGSVDGFCEVVDIRKKLLRRKDSFKTCHRKIQKKGDTPLGAIKFVWHIDEIGRVTKSKMVQNTTESPALAECLRAEIQSLRFTRPNSGTCDVEWTLSFSP